MKNTTSAPPRPPNCLSFKNEIALPAADNLHLYNYIRIYSLTCIFILGRVTENNQPKPHSPILHSKAIPKP